MAYDKIVDSAKLDGEMTATADAIRAKTGGTDAVPWEDGAGFADALGNVYEAGQKTQYDEFWDAFQNYGNLNSDYSLLFSGRGWNDISFAPKYDLKPTNAYAMFWQSFNLTDISKGMVAHNVILDFSNCTNMQMTFCDSAIKKIGIVDASKATNMSQTFNSWRLQSIEKLILSSQSNSNSSNQPFKNASSLEHCIFDGTMAYSISLEWSTLLDRDSIESVINALSLNTNDKALTLSLTAVNNAFETSAGAADGSASAEWLDLAATKSNWTITLI